MAIDRQSLTTFNLGWLALAALAAGGSLAAWFMPTAALDWQPGLAVAEPWRCVTAAFVHWSGRHLGANLAGTAVVAALGWSARLPAALAVAWALSWPLTHLGLLVQPALLHYGGLSGVLHAAVAVVAVGLLALARGRRRWVGAAIGVGLAIKVLGEQPWGSPLREVAGWDIALAPIGHASGAVSGALCAIAALAWLRWQRR